MLCLVLAVFASTLTAIHVHQQQGAENPSKAHCLICVATHSPTVLVAAAVPTPHVSSAHATVRLVECDHRSRLFSPELFIRPPPAI
jgi:hypothetical protein